MRALDLKLSRDLWRLRGQVLAVALVVASGAAVLVMSLSALTSLSVTMDAYYERYRFAEVFANVKRAPERLVERIAEIPGVQTVETRISAFTTIDVADMAEPVIGQLVSLPDHGEPNLNRLAYRAGRGPAPGRDDEAVLIEPFAEAHGLEVGDSLSLLLNGAKREVRVVGVALSPEFVYAIAPGSLLPDDARYGVIWMGRRALAAAYDLDGAFNDVVLGLLRGADPDEVIARLDPLLERYGGAGAIAREHQISHWFLRNELDQLRSMATILPSIFLSVAAFLINNVLARLIATERREISLMKAFGYTNLQVGLHYSKMAVAMALVGVAMGWVVGAYLGRLHTELYSDFFRFPFLHYSPSGAEFVLSAAIGVGAALFGALWAVRGAVALTPAEAMRPPAPEEFGRTPLPAAITTRLDNPTRMILRHIVRAPVRSAMTAAGISFSLALLLLALQWTEAINRMAVSYFEETQRQDATVGFFEARAAEARFALSRLPGVMAVEPMRFAAAEISAGTVTHRGAVSGLPPDARMQVISDVRGWSLPPPRAGVVVGTFLARKLGVGVGDSVTIKLLEGRRTVFEAKVSAVYETYVGMPAFMNLAELNRRLGDPPSFTFANLHVDPAKDQALYATLKDTPAVSAVMVKKNAIQKFHDTLGETVLIFVSFFVAFAGLLTVGVVYNATRITLSERGRELATLRVLGFTRWEISYILLGEAALLTLIALPLGCLAGVGLVWFMAQSFETELFRLPIVLPPAAFAKAVVAVLISAVISAAIVRRRIDRLDLIAVLKTRE